MICYKCPNCRQTLESPSSLAGQSDTCPVCGTICAVPACRRRRLPVSALVGAVATLLVVVAVLTGWWYWSGGGPGTADPGEQAASLDWPFHSEPPEGFRRSDQRHWRGRTLWVFDGPKFGKATSKLLVMRSLPETISGDSRLATLQAAKLAVALDIEAPLKGEELRFTWVFPEDRTIVWIGPKFGAPPAPPYPGGPVMDFGWSAGVVPMSEVGRPEDFVPGNLAAWSAVPGDSLLVVAWAGDAKAKGQQILQSFCRDLQNESSEHWHPPALAGSVGSPFDESVPNEYRLHGRMEHEGMGLWVFRAQRGGRPDEVLIAVRWDCKLGEQGIFPPLASCASWAARILTGADPGLGCTHVDLAAAAMLEQAAGRGMFTVSQPWKSEGKSFGFTAEKHLLTIGEPRGGVLRLSVHGRSGQSVQEVIAVSGFVDLGRKPPRWAGMVFAGAIADTSSHGLDRIARAVDHCRANWKQERK